MKLSWMAGRDIAIGRTVPGDPRDGVRFGARVRLRRKDLFDLCVYCLFNIVTLFAFTAFVNIKDLFIPAAFLERN